MVAFVNNSGVISAFDDSSSPAIETKWLKDNLRIEPYGNYIRLTSVNQNQRASVDYLVSNIVGATSANQFAGVLLGYLEVYGGGGGSSLTPDQLAAIQGANAPSGSNPFATQGDLSPLSIDTTKTALATLITNSEITIGAKYRITDAVQGVIWVWGVDANVISTNAALEGDYDGTTSTVGSWGDYDLVNDFYMPNYSGENYISLLMKGSRVENRAELDAAYTFAKSLAPSEPARYTIVIPPCYIDGETNNFIIDAEFIDIKSLTGKPDVIFVNGTIEVDTSNIHLVGLNVGLQAFTLTSDDASNLYEHCVGGSDSFGASGTASGTFNNCIGGDSSFGASGTASGTFNNCIGGDQSFGGGGTASGTFNNCIGGIQSFGGNFGTASGVFNNCIGGIQSFGSLGTVSGTFTNCLGDDNSFAGTLEGKCYNCRIIGTNFPTVATGGITRLCINGDNTEDNQG
jgi:hypothetical protein